MARGEVSLQVFLYVPITAVTQYYAKVIGHTEKGASRIA
jgi:hypothetical protein